jgi:CheY-like chemotaxis protein
MAIVLVVEDEFGIAELFDAVLTDEGYRVVTAMNGKQGLEMLVQGRPDMVFMDYMMPVMDGSAMLAAMQADPSLQQIPVVMMSSMPEATVAERCSGYVMFMRKPFKIFELVEVVKRVIATGGPSSPSMSLGAGH